MQEGAGWYGYFLLNILTSTVKSDIFSQNYSLAQPLAWLSLILKAEKQCFHGTILIIISQPFIGSDGGTLRNVRFIPERQTLPRTAFKETIGL